MTADYAPEDVPEVAPPHLVQSADDESRRRGAYRVEVGDVSTWEPTKVLSTAAAMLRSRWQRPAAQQMHPDDAAVGLALADLLDEGASTTALLLRSTAATLFAHELATAWAVLTGERQGVQP